MRQSIEHIGPDSHLLLMSEIFRILRLGGTFRGSTHNFDSTCLQYLNSHITFLHAMSEIMSGAYSQMTYDTADGVLKKTSSFERKYQDVHKSCFTYGILLALFDKVGFVVNFDESPGIKDGDYRTAWWFVWEAVKPLSRQTAEPAIKQDGGV